jgi:cytochrome P450
LAGSDTTASAIRITLLHIMTTPRVYQTLRAEIDAADRENRLSRPIIRESEAKILPYLQGCIYEGLRIGPPITSLVPKQTPPEGDFINGMFIPGGTAIGTSFFGIQRNKTVYGDDADVFRPERWLPGAVDPERRKRMDQSVDTVFMHGRFYCLGKMVAFIELNKVFVEVRIPCLLIYIYIYTCLIADI